MQTMRKKGLTEVLTNDRHFEQEGFRGAVSRFVKQFLRPQCASRSKPRTGKNAPLQRERAETRRVMRLCNGGKPILLDQR